MRSPAAWTMATGGAEGVVQLRAGRPVTADEERRALAVVLAVTVLLTTDLRFRCRLASTPFTAITGMLPSDPSDRFL